MKTICDLRKTKELEKHHSEICDAKIKKHKELEKKAERTRKLAVVVKDGLIIPPKGLWRWKKCPECGERINIKKWSDGGYPDYGDKYMYSICEKCGYEHGKTGKWALEYFETVVCAVGILAVIAFCLFGLAIIADFYFNFGFQDFLHRHIHNW